MRKVASLLGLMSILCSVSVAQTEPLSPAPVPDPGPVKQQAPLYRIQVDDVIRIEIRPELTPTDVIVQPDGNISAPFLGLIKAEGRSFTELYEDLKTRYTAILFLQAETIRLTVTPIRIRQIRASVVGAVVRPGLYDVRRGDRISTLLANAQGAPTDGTADLRRATLRKLKSQEVIPIDLYSLVTKGDASQDYEVEDGDILTIPQEVRNRIAVDGEVKAPGVIPYSEGLSVAQAITRSGGRTDKSRMTKVTVIRPRPGRPDDPDYINVDLVSFYNQKDRTQNIELKPGDTVFVPNNGNPDFATINSYFNFFYLLRTVGFNPFGF